MHKKRKRLSKNDRRILFLKNISVKGVKNMELSQKALNERRRCRREYMKEWRKNNPEKIAAIENRYWERKAEKAEREEQTNDAD
jgi:uncharacterized protein YnzC (UPF0291/DUF896 family)